MSCTPLIGRPRPSPSRRSSLAKPSPVEERAHPVMIGRVKVENHCTRSESGGGKLLFYNTAMPLISIK
jgi:hypothetical protein